VISTNTTVLADNVNSRRS